MSNIIDQVEAGLASYACTTRTSMGRRFKEEEETFRTPYQRDTDRILYSTAFRRLQFKTQVYVVHEGDFYRTRLTHSLEVAQQAKTFARLIHANEDLAEAIALAHDLGHAPFGHSGESALQTMMEKHGGFDHNLQSLRVVDVLENRHPHFDGLNLTYEVREGLARHKTEFDNPQVPEEFKRSAQPGIEAQIVNLADETAFATHDLDDAIEQGLVSLERLRDCKIPSVEAGFRRVEEELGPLHSTDRTLFGKRLVRHLISSLIWAASRKTLEIVKEYAIESPEQVRGLSRPVAVIGEEWREDFPRLKRLLLDEVYHHPNVVVMVEKGKFIIERIFEAYLQNDKLLPFSIRRKLQGDGSTHDYKVICDYICGMTDAYASQVYNALFTPLFTVPERYGK